MKKITKALNLILACVVGFGALSFVGCGDEKNKDIDPTKTQLEINHYLGGVGNAWLYDVKTRFEAAYSDYQGVNGKVGVEVRINDQKKNGEDLFNELGMTSDEIFFTDKSKLYDMVLSDYVLDISSVVTEQNADGKTIESKLTDQQKSYFKMNGKYYALPHYESFGGLTYNVNIFNDYELFFAKGGCPSEFCAFTQSNNADKAAGSFTGYKYTGENGVKSAGPDGKYGTYDDGLPATYDEFFVLCDKMKGDVTPFIWSGQFGKAYMNYLLSALYADYEGSEVKTAFDFNGTLTHIVKSVNGDVVEFEPATEINNENGYLAFKSAGYYYSLKFVERMLSDTDYYSANLNSNAHSHTQAQIDYVLSEFDQKFNQNGKPIAMLVEGSYWENEAKDYGVFDRVKKYGKSAADCRYAYMPVPKVNEELVGTKCTTGEGLGNISFISSKIASEKVDLAKKFLKFCYTDESLDKFTQISGVRRAIKYDVSATDSLSNYAKSIVDLKKSENTDVIYMVSDNPLYLQNQSYFSYRYSSEYDTYALVPLKDGKTALQVFNKICEKRSQSAWNAQFNKYFS